MFSRNIAPWNTLHTMYTAVMIAVLALKAGATRNQALVALALTALEPFGFISS